MHKSLQTNTLIECGVSAGEANFLIDKINHLPASNSPEQNWKMISKQILNPSHPFALHHLLFSYCYPDWQNHPDTAPAWIPENDFIATTHLKQFMLDVNAKDVKQFHHWTISHYPDFLQKIITKLSIPFQKKPDEICNLDNGVESPQWFKGAKLNIVESCFTAPPEKTAILYLDKNKLIQKLSYKELDQLSNRIANGLIRQGFSQGDAIAIDMPMTKEAVAIYLGIIKMGGAVVSIADSFSAEEIATRLRITKAKGIFTQDIIQRGEKQLPLYEKVIAANAPLAIVIPCQETISIPLREKDLSWQSFLDESCDFTASTCDPMSHINILFSSGTTGDPKAIPWNHSTAIKAGSDAYLHHNIQPEDILAWPTNLGWMMGPWLIFAALMNKATLALYHDAPTDRTFGEFIQNAKVTMLGVVPTLVASWRQSHCMENLNWQSIKLFSSTGECSNPEDMLYLMSLAAYKPIIEYCGGTEIGGSYITSTLLENNYLSLFNTPTMGLDLVLLNEEGKPTNNGEVALIPPSLGLSTELLNADHQQIYYANMPTHHGKKLRRHGDQAQQLANGCYSILGRVDDTMNLGGIKVSSAEIERVLAGISGVIETAAIAVSPPHNGPSQLVIYAATSDALNEEDTRKSMQKKINLHLNPLFKIHKVVFTDALPKTASNKIMRRVLRKKFQEVHSC